MKLHIVKNCLNCGVLTTNNKYCTHKCWMKNAKKNPALLFSLAGKASARLMKEMKTGLYNPKIRKLGIETNRKNKTSFFDIKIQRLGAYAAQKVLREKKLSCFYNPEQNRIARENNFKQAGAHRFKTLKFDSKVEMEIGLCIHFQIEKLKNNINLHKWVGCKEIDFVLNSIDCAIEVHPNSFGRNVLEYFKQRRKTLDENGFKNYNLLVIK